MLGRNLKGIRSLGRSGEVFLMILIQNRKSPRKDVHHVIWEWLGALWAEAHMQRLWVGQTPDTAEQGPPEAVGRVGKGPVQLWLSITTRRPCGGFGTGKFTNSVKQWQVVSFVIPLKKLLFVLFSYMSESLITIILHSFFAFLSFYICIYMCAHIHTGSYIYLCSWVIKY